jgi:hypothetical protein
MFFRLTIVFFLLLIAAGQALAAVMSSDNFSLQSDSINFAGGPSASDSYLLESTVGEIATGESFSDSYQLRAGYQQMQETYLAVIVADDVLLQPSLPGLTGGNATGSLSVVVVTDNTAGYDMHIKADSEPAMQSTTDSVDDYVPVGSVPDLAFQLPSSEARFGFAVFGDDAAERYQSSGGVCGVSGISIINTCWDGLSTTSELIARSIISNHPNGATTTLLFQVGIGAAVGVPPGAYVATSTITVTPR